MKLADEAYELLSEYRQYGCDFDEMCRVFDVYKQARAGGAA